MDPAGQGDFRDGGEFGTIRTVTGADRHAALYGLHEPRQLGRVCRRLEIPVALCFVKAGLQKIEASRARGSHELAEFGMPIVSGA